MIQLDIVSCQLLEQRKERILFERVELNRPGRPSHDGLVMNALLRDAKSAAPHNLQALLDRALSDQAGDEPQRLNRRVGDDIELNRPAPLLHAAVVLDPRVGQCDIRDRDVLIRREELHCREAPSNLDHMPKVALARVDELADGIRPRREELQR